MKRIALLRERSLPAATTGSHVPVTGLWSPEGEEDIVRAFSEGHVFPAHNGSATTWLRRPPAETSR
jgi:hypothetical protein